MFTEYLYIATAWLLGGYTTTCIIHALFLEISIPLYLLNELDHRSDTLAVFAASGEL